MKKIYLLCTNICISFFVLAQSYTPPSFAEVDTNYRRYVNQIFGTLEPNRVSTGLEAKSYLC